MEAYTYKVPHLLSKGCKKGAFIHKSTKRENMWQVTRWDEDGFSGDAQLKTKELAIEYAIEDGYIFIDNGDTFKYYSNTKRFLEGVISLYNIQTTLMKG